MTKISTRQLLFFLALVAPVGKIIFMPAQLARFAANDLLFPALMNILIEAGAVFLVLLISKSNQTFYELLENTFGKVAAKCLIAVFGLFLLFASFLPILEQKHFIQSVMYDTLPTVFSYLPLFLLIGFLCLKPLSSFGRIWDILALFSAVGFLGILVLSVGQANLKALLPVGASGASGIFGGMAYSMSWFYDSALLLLLMGRFPYEKGLAWKGTLCYLGGGLLILIFLAVFYGIFESISVMQLFAFTKISKYFSGITVLGRIDYFFIYALSLVMAFYCALPGAAGAECFKEAFGWSKLASTLYALGAMGLLIAFTLLFHFSVHAVQEVITTKLFFLFPVFTVLVPALALLLRRNREKE